MQLEENDLEIFNECSLHHYRTEIPNIVFEMNLDVYEFSTYCHLKRSAGDNGKCWKSSKTLCSQIGISHPKLIEIKKTLSEKGLIRVEKRQSQEKGSLTDLVTIVDLWNINMKKMSDKYPSRGGKQYLGGGVNAVNGGGKQHLPKQEPKEQEPKEQQQQPAAASFYKELKDIQIPDDQKIEISRDYPIERVKHALLWLQHNKKPLTKGIAAAIKWAAKNLPKIYMDNPVEKIPVNPEGYNRAYFGEIAIVARRNGYRLDQIGFRDGNEYVQTEHDKIYYKDVGFLEQISNYLRKKSVDCRSIFDTIKACQTQLSKEMA